MDAANGRPRMKGSGLHRVWRPIQDRFWRGWKTLDLWIESRFPEDQTGLDDAIVHQFKGDAEAIEEAPMPVSAHALLYLIVTLLALALLWAVFGMLDRIVVAQGKIATRTPMIVMQPFVTSRI